jgi:hypothetical protein
MLSVFLKTYNLGEIISETTSKAAPKQYSAKADSMKADSMKADEVINWTSIGSLAAGIVITGLYMLYDGVYRYRHYENMKNIKLRGVRKLHTTPGTRHGAIIHVERQNTKESTVVYFHAGQLATYYHLCGNDGSINIRTLSGTKCFSEVFDEAQKNKEHAEIMKRIVYLRGTNTTENVEAANSLLQTMRYNLYIRKEMGGTLLEPIPLPPATSDSEETEEAKEAKEDYELRMLSLEIQDTDILNPMTHIDTPEEIKERKDSELEFKSLIELLDDCSERCNPPIRPLREEVDMKETKATVVYSGNRRLNNCLVEDVKSDAKADAKSNQPTSVLPLASVQAVEPEAAQEAAQEAAPDTKQVSVPKKEDIDGEKEFDPFTGLLSTDWSSGGIRGLDSFPKLSKRLNPEEKKDELDTSPPFDIEFGVMSQDDILQTCGLAGFMTTSKLRKIYKPPYDSTFTKPPYVPLKAFFEG